MVISLRVPEAWLRLRGRIGYADIAALGAAMADGALVVVHGVGAKRPGDMLKQFAGDAAGEVEETVAGGHRFAHAKLTGHPHFSDIYECFYADLKPGARGPFSRIDFPFRLLLVLSQLGGWGWKGDAPGVGGKSFFGIVSHILLFSGVVALPGLMFSLMHIYVLGVDLGQWAAIAACAPTMLLAFLLRRVDAFAFISFFLTPVLAAGVIFWAHQIENAGGSFEMFPVIAARTLSIAQIVALSLILLGVLEVSVRSLIAVAGGAKFSLTGWLVRFTSLALPFVLIGGAVGAFAWAANVSTLWLLGAEHIATFRTEWAPIYKNALTYDLATMEFIYGAATGAFGLFLALGFMLYLLLIRLPLAGKQQWPLGAFIRFWLRLSMALLFVLMSIVAAFFAVDTISSISALPQIGPLTDRYVDATLAAMGSTRESVYDIYLSSSARLLGFAPLLLPTLATATITACDVAMYVSPVSSTDYGPAARARLKALIDDLKLRHGDRIVVAAYSQGSIVSAETLDEMEGAGVTFVTMGSPIDTLYRRFLGRSFIASAPRNAAHWANLYRGSDFIGGRIEAAQENRLVHGSYAAHHMRYARESEVVAELAPAARA